MDYCYLYNIKPERGTLDAIKCTPPEVTIA